jgi:hypothetical protein
MPKIADATMAKTRDRIIDVIRLSQGDQADTTVLASPHQLGHRLTRL